MQPPREGRLPVPFADRSTAAQLVGALVVPAIIGALSGVLIGVSVAAYWGLQVLAATGGLLSGLEHRGAWAGADRGLVGGSVFGSFLLLAHAVAGTEARVSLGSAPGVLVIFTGVISAVLGATGGALAAAARRRAAERAATDRRTAA